MFAQKYISKQSYPYGSEKISLPASFGMVVVIPCFDEPGLGDTLEALMQCRRPACDVAVLLVVNHSSEAASEVVEQNLEALAVIDTYNEKAGCGLNFISIYAPNLSPKHAGAGLARKIGMDAAVNHFNRHNMPHGIIVSLDADTLPSVNYLVSVYRYFANEPDYLAASIYFEHAYDKSKAGQAIVLYELYLRYYRHALQHIGFPHAIYTVGSAFAVKAGAYVAQGGMSRKKAGEDFYFLHKLTAQTKIGFINQAVVYPSSRVSHRVPFGTGVVVEQYLKGERELEKTYPLEAFQRLKGLFAGVAGLYSLPIIHLGDLSHDALLCEFLNRSGFVNDLNELKRNCSNVAVFEKRFFLLFNAFKLLKWLNFAVENGLEKQDLMHEASVLYTYFHESEVLLNPNAETLLIMYRKLDKILK